MTAIYNQWLGGVSCQPGHGMNMGDVANTICDREEELLPFSFSQILVATDNLSERNLDGNGGFGRVYKVMFWDNLYDEMNSWTVHVWHRGQKNSQNTPSTWWQGPSHVASCSCLMIKSICSLGLPFSNTSTPAAYKLTDRKFSSPLIHL